MACNCSTASTSAPFPSCRSTAAGCRANEVLPAQGLGRSVPRPPPRRPPSPPRRCQSCWPSAERYGWVNRALDADDLDSFVDALARGLPKSGPPYSTTIRRGPGISSGRIVFGTCAVSSEHALGRVTRLASREVVAGGEPRQQLAHGHAGAGLLRAHAHQGPGPLRYHLRASRWSAARCAHLGGHALPRCCQRAKSLGGPVATGSWQAQGGVDGIDLTVKWLGGAPSPSSSTGG